MPTANAMSKHLGDHQPAKSQAVRTLGACNIGDLRERARRVLPWGIFQLIDGGSDDEISLRNNRAAFERIRFAPRTLVDVSKRSQAITLFGKQFSMPTIIGPTGSGGVCAYHGEILQAKAAAAAGIPFVVALVSMTAMEDVMERGGGGTLWFQMYLWPDRRLSYDLMERARATGFETLVVTTDTPVLGNLESNIRSGFKVPFRLTPRTVADLIAHPRWVARVLLPYFLEGKGGMPKHENYPEELRRGITQAPSRVGIAATKADSQSWEDLRAVRRRWQGSLVVKGVLTPEDAISAAECGVDGVVVSNHGGRGLDGVVSPMEVLPRIVDAVGGRLTVMVDSGFRRGTDVLKALALGARAVLLGRAPLYGLAAAGEPGVARALAIFREEIDRGMALLGCTTIAELGPACIESSAPLSTSARAFQTAEGIGAIRRAPDRPSVV